MFIEITRGKSPLESWVTIFLADWQPPLIFVQFTSKSHEHYSLTLLEHMQKKFEINRTKIKGGCQSGRKVVTHNSKSDSPLALAADAECSAIGRKAPKVVDFQRK